SSVKKIMNTEENASFIKNLFQLVDKNNDNQVDMDELLEILKKIGVPSEKSRQLIAKRIIEEGGSRPGLKALTFQEFAHYVFEQEKKLQLIFSLFDSKEGNVDGKFDANDLSIYFEKLGIKLGSDDASKLIQKMDQDGSLEITYDEWRNFFLLNPAIGEQNPSEMLQYWRAASHFDFGEASFTVPDVVIKGIINMKLVIHVTGS
ncbi:unnamed protein product, partial [Didymodactylos carnosus]